MAGMAGSLQRPVFAVAAGAAALVSSDLPNKIHNSKSSDHVSTTAETQSHDLSASSSSWVSNVSDSKLAKLSFVTRIGVPLPEVKMPPSKNGGHLSRSFPDSSFATSPVLLKFYQSADLARSAKPTRYTFATTTSPSSSEELYRWHLPDPKSVDVSGNNPGGCSSAKGKTVVVLLGWLGAKQKHLNRYAEFYTSRGHHAITFTFPMSEVLSYQVGGKAEQDIELLVSHLADWLEEEHGKNLVFHTFSNTGWLTYGVVLENLQKLDPSLLGRIKGCVVDSAPVATPDAQVWASGFSAAFLKKQSSATKGSKVSSDDSSTTNDAVVYTKTVATQHKPPVTEAALLAILEKFFKVVLNIPSVNRRLTDVMGLLSSQQPSCPQLYIYSSADKVIPADSVETFVEKQRKNGLQVRACNFISTPHVDHFRNNPQLYESELTLFLNDFVHKSCKGSSSC